MTTETDGLRALEARIHAIAPHCIRDADDKPLEDWVSLEDVGRIMSAITAPSVGALDETLLAQITSLTMSDRVLRSALKDLLEQCEQADGEGDLSGHVTGDVLHAARLAVEGKTPYGAQVISPSPKPDVTGELALIGEMVDAMADACHWMISEKGRLPYMYDPKRLTALVGQGRALLSRARGE